VDAERTRYEDASFEVVSSSVGVIFAPERRAELDRTMAGVYERFRGEDGIHQSRPYLVILGTRR
jgi:hypothetical protein